MLTAALIVVSLVLGYVVTVALSMVSTFAIVHFRRGLVVQDRRLRTRYKLLQDLLWIVYSAVGGYLALLAANHAPLPLTAMLLAAILILVLWKNSQETRQVGLLYMLLTSACIIAGIAAAYMLRIWQTH
ncbi:MAG: hypothetical protein JSS95_13880 [Acidobacteria bacterium]|nr:hypothetical protein [Acidobacteriota bacterium]